MIRDRHAFQQFEARLQRRTAADLETNLQVFETLMEHARSLGVWPPVDPLEGLEVDVRVAKALNTHVRKPAAILR